MSWIKAFLISCSGVELEFLRGSTSEHTKYVSIGGCVFSTAIFAFIAMSYAISRVFYGHPLVGFFAIGLGALWGLTIFNLDRYIVSSMIKGDHWFQEFLIALPRILLAALISIVVARPIEVIIFESRIEEHVVHEKKDEGKRNLKLLSAMEDSLIRRIDTLRIDQTAAMNNAQEQRKKINAYIIRQDSIIFAKKIKLDSLFLRLLPQQLKNSIPNWPSIIKQIDANLQMVLRNCETRIRQDSMALENIRMQKGQLEAVIAGDTTAYEDLKFEKQLELLAELIDDEAKKGNNTPYFINFFIMLLFFTIETSPIIVKLISRKGPYDVFIHDEAADEITGAKRRREHDNEKLEMARDEELDFLRRMLEKLRPVSEKKIDELVVSMRETGWRQYIDFLKKLLREDILDWLDEKRNFAGVSLGDRLKQNRTRLLVASFIVLGTITIYILRGSAAALTAFTFLSILQYVFDQRERIVVFFKRFKSKSKAKEKVEKNPSDVKSDKKQ